MSQYIIEKLKKYIMHCRQLRDFIGCSVADLQFMKGGGTIIYAVDFSEIYSYLNPNNVVEEFSFVANYSTLDAKLIQRLVLHHFFYASPNKHILLNPYAIELEGFVAQGKEGAYVNMAREALRVYKEIETLPQNARFLSISQKIKRKKNLVKRDFDDIYEFLKSSAPSLLNILNPPWKEPLVLLKELFERQTFQNLTDIGISRAEISSDEEVEDRWLQTLVAFRGEQSISSSIIDANAAGILIRVNQLLKDRNIRVLLVTRSKYMHET